MYAELLFLTRTSYAELFLGAPCGATRLCTGSLLVCGVVVFDADFVRGVIFRSAFRRCTVVLGVVVFDAELLFF